MTDQEVRRIETALENLGAEVNKLGNEVARGRQWEEDREAICDRHGEQIETLAAGLAQERLDRTSAVGKVWTEIGRKLGARAALASFLGTLIPGVLMWWKFGPALAEMAKTTQQGG